MWTRIAPASKKGNLLRNERVARFFGNSWPRRRVRFRLRGDLGLADRASDHFGIANEGMAHVRLVLPAPREHGKNAKNSQRTNDASHGSRLMPARRGWLLSSS